MCGEGTAEGAERGKKRGVVREGRGKGWRPFSRSDERRGTGVDTPSEDAPYLPLEDNSTQRGAACPPSSFLLPAMTDRCVGLTW